MTWVGSRIRIRNLTLEKRLAGSGINHSGFTTLLIQNFLDGAIMFDLVFLKIFFKE